MNIFSRLNVRVVAIGVLLITLVWFSPQPAGAVDREHQQLMADIRMLQEQSQQLQALIGGLNDALKVVSAKIDDQTGMTRKAFADEKVVVDAISGSMREIREKVDETNVRLGSLSQEMEAMRLAIQQAAAAPPPLTSDATLPPGSTAPAPAAMPAPVGPGMSPDRLFETAYADYTAGQYGLAIQGFSAYLSSFPKGNRADEALYYIGESHSYEGKFQEAIEAYNRLIGSYPNSRMVPTAYYKRGGAYERLAQLESARQSYEIVIKQFPNDTAANLAKQSLGRMDAPAR